MPAQHWCQSFFVQGWFPEKLDRVPAEQTLASRIGDAARGGEILVSSALHRLVEGAADVAFGDPRELDLKGLSNTHVVHAVAWECAP